MDIACVLELTSATTVTTNGPTDNAGPSGLFSAWIVWGRDIPVVLTDATPTTIGGAKGSLVEVTPDGADPMCSGTAQLRTGVAGVSISNGRAPAINTCDVVTELLTRIVEHA